MSFSGEDGENAVSSYISIPSKATTPERTHQTTMDDVRVEIDALAHNLSIPTVMILSKDAHRAPSGSVASSPTRMHDVSLTVSEASTPAAPPNTLMAAPSPLMSRLLQIGDQNDQNDIAGTDQVFVPRQSPPNSNLGGPHCQVPQFVSSSPPPAQSSRSTRNLRLAAPIRRTSCQTNFIILEQRLRNHSLAHVAFSAILTIAIIILFVFVSIPTSPGAG